MSQNVKSLNGLDKLAHIMEAVNCYPDKYQPEAIALMVRRDQLRAEGFEQVKMASTLMSEPAVKERMGLLKERRELRQQIETGMLAWNKDGGVKNVQGWQNLNGEQVLLSYLATDGEALAQARRLQIVEQTLEQNPNKEGVLFEIHRADEFGAQARKLFREAEEIDRQLKELIAEGGDA